jgi:hypothetical protein
MSLEYTFTAPIWVWEDAGVRALFLRLPKDIAAEILTEAKAAIPKRKSVPVFAIVGNTRWETAIFRDEAENTYSLPLKAAVRDKELLREGEMVEATIVLNFEPRTR